MILKGIIDCDFVNYKEPVLTLEFPRCNFKCDKLNGTQVCQNSALAREPDYDVPLEAIWNLYISNPITKGFCCQGLEPFDSPNDLDTFLNFIRHEKQCNDVIIIYTGYDKDECHLVEWVLRNLFHNIIIKWGRFIVNQNPHYDEILGVNLASDNQYAEYIS